MKGPLVEVSGAVDLHSHPAPDLFPRLADDVDVAVHAAERGFRAVMIMADAVQAIGADRCLLVSEAAQRHNPMPAEALRIFPQSLFESGLSEERISSMIRTNPSDLLDLGPPATAAAPSGTEEGGAVTDPVRVGLLVPSSNTVMEVDFHRHLPAARFTVHTGRMRLEETTPEAESEMLDHHVMPAALDVGTARPDLVVFGCTSAGALRGNDADRELCERIAGATGAAVVSTIRSVRAALERRGARRVAVITPYVDELNERIGASIEADGVEVSVIRGMGITENFAIARVQPPEIVRFAADAVDGVRVDLVFASCTNLRAIDAMAGIERAAGVPVVTSNQAVLEAVLLGQGLAWPGASDGPEPVRAGG